MSAKRMVTVAVLITILSLLLAACGGDTPTNTPVAAPTTAPAEATNTAAPADSGNSGANVSGELSVYLNSYYDPTADKETSDLMTSIAKEYESSHPGVKINLVAALPAGTKGHDKWSDSLPSYVIAQTRAADGNWYQVSLDWVETGLYYNKDIFSKAGVDPSTWNSWGKFVTDMQSIKTKTGVDPLGMFIAQQGWSNWWWVDDMLLTANWADKANDFYLPKYNIDGIAFRQLNPEEVSKAILDGKLSATDPRMDGYLAMSKQYISLLPSDYAGIPNLDELDPLFYSGKVATVWTGTWKNKPYVANIPFDYGITYLPPFTKDDAPGATGTAYRVGGPSSAGQYGIAQSAVKAGKLDLAVDFLQFLSAPQNFGRLAKSYGGYIPMVAGTEAGEVMQGFSKIADLPERLFNDPDNRLTVESGNLWSQAMQAYFLGQADEAATKTKLQQIWMDGAKAVCAAQKYDWCPK